MDTQTNKPKKLNARQIRDEKILRHGYRLREIFPETKKGDRGFLFPGIGPAELCRQLRRLEAEAHRLAERECNEPLPEGYSEKKTASILKRLDAILGFKALGIPVFVNGDPRGYALKIDDAYVTSHGLEIERDMGGYGLIAPEF